MWGWETAGGGGRVEGAGGGGVEGVEVLRDCVVYG